MQEKTATDSAPQYSSTPVLHPPNPGHPFRLLLDAVFVARPVLWIPVWAFALLGYFSSLRLGLGAAYTALWDLRWAADFGWIVVFSCAVGAVYVVNQIADLRVDRANEGFPLLARGRVSTKTAWIAACALGVFSALVPLAGKPVIAAFSLATLIVGAAYSSPPLSLSGRPFGDFLTNAVGFGIIAFGAGWALSPAALPLASRQFAGAAAPYFLLMCAGSISSTVPDIPGDRAHGKRTTAVALGALPAHLLAAAFLAAAAGAAWRSADWVALTCALVALPVYAAYLAAPKKILMEATYKAGGAVLMAAAAVIAPLFGCAAIVVFAGTRMYFLRRFGVRYPALLPADGDGERGRRNATS